jgi:CheY-like chemotaxis protein
MEIDLVMLIDDNDTDNFINKRILELSGFGYRIEIKNSGKSALEYLESMQDDEENIPDVVFLDINMPVVNGFVFLYEFEKLPEIVKKKSKIVILSSSENKRDMQRMVSNDLVKMYLTKPLTEEALEQVRKKVQE